MFLIWVLREEGRMRPFVALSESVASVMRVAQPRDGGAGEALSGGRGERAPRSVREAARSATIGGIRRGGEVVRPGVVRVHIDDPAAMLAYSGRHPAQVAHANGRG